MAKALLHFLCMHVFPNICPQQQLTREDMISLVEAFYPYIAPMAVLNGHITFGRLKETGADAVSNYEYTFKFNMIKSDFEEKYDKSLEKTHYTPLITLMQVLQQHALHVYEYAKKQWNLYNKNIVNMSKERCKLLKISDPHDFVSEDIKQGNEAWNMITNDSYSKILKCWHPDIWPKLFNIYSNEFRANIDIGSVNLYNFILPTAAIQEMEPFSAEKRKLILKEEKKRLRTMICFGFIKKYDDYKATLESACRFRHQSVIVTLLTIICRDFKTNFAMQPKKQACISLSLLFPAIDTTDDEMIMSPKKFKRLHHIVFQYLYALKQNKNRQLSGHKMQDLLFWIFSHKQYKSMWSWVWSLFDIGHVVQMNICDHCIAVENREGLEFILMRRIFETEQYLRHIEGRKRSPMWSIMTKGTRNWFINQLHVQDAKLQMKEESIVSQKRGHKDLGLDLTEAEKKRIAEENKALVEEKIIEPLPKKQKLIGNYFKKAS